MGILDNEIRAGFDKKTGALNVEYIEDEGGIYVTVVVDERGREKALEKFVRDLHDKIGVGLEISDAHKIGTLGPKYDVLSDAEKYHLVLSSIMVSSVV